MGSGKQNCSMSMGSALKMHCIRLCFLFSESVSEHPTLQCDSSTARIRWFADTSIICPPVDEQLLGTYFSYLIQTSFLAPPQPNQNDITEFKLKAGEHNSYEWNRLPSAEAYRALITLYQADKKHQNNSRKTYRPVLADIRANKLQFHLKKCSIHCWQTLFGFQDMG